MVRCLTLPLAAENLRRWPPAVPAPPRLDKDHQLSRAVTHARPLRRVGVVPAVDKSEDSREKRSRLNRTAWALAVYASQRGSPLPTQDSLPAAGQALPGGIRSPAGFR